MEVHSVNHSARNTEQNCSPSFYELSGRALMVPSCFQGWLYQLWPHGCQPVWPYKGADNYTLLNFNPYLYQGTQNGPLPLHVPCKCMTPASQFT